MWLSPERDSLTPPLILDHLKIVLVDRYWRTVRLHVHCKAPPTAVSSTWFPCEIVNSSRYYRSTLIGHPTYLHSLGRSYNMFYLSLEALLPANLFASVVHGYSRYMRCEDCLVAINFARTYIQTGRPTASYVLSVDYTRFLNSSMIHTQPVKGLKGRFCYVIWTVSHSFLRFRWFVRKSSKVNKKWENS